MFLVYYEHILHFSTWFWQAQMYLGPTIKLSVDYNGSHVNQGYVLKNPQILLMVQNSCLRTTWDVSQNPVKYWEFFLPT